MAEYTEARKKANRKYDSKTYELLTLRLKKGQKEEIQAAATAINESLNGYIIQAIAERMERDAPKPGP